MSRPLAEQPVSPPEPQEAPTKKITVTVALTGSFETEIEVPDSLDITDRMAVEDAMDQDGSAPWGRFYDFSLGDLWEHSKTGNDPARYESHARVWLEGVEE